MEGREVLPSGRQPGLTRPGSARILAALAVLLFALGGSTLLAPTASAEIVCEMIPGPNGQMEEVCTEVEGGGGGGGEEGGGGGGGGRVPIDTYATPACSINGPPPNDPGVMCMGATQTCELRGEEGTFMRYYVLWEEGEPWELQGTWCSGTVDEAVNPEPDPQEIATEMARQFLPDSDVNVSPDEAEVLTQLPVIYYATADSYEDTVDLLGVTITIRARASEFVWTWGDGDSDTVTRKGIPFNGNPDDPAYVTHAYGSPGTYTADLLVRWNGEYQIGGSPWRQLPEMEVDRGTTQPVTVTDKDNRLSGDR